MATIDDTGRFLVAKTPGLWRARQYMGYSANVLARLKRAAVLAVLCLSCGSTDSHGHYESRLIAVVGDCKVYEVNGGYFALDIVRCPDSVAMVKR